MAHEGLQLELRAALLAAASHGTATLGREASVKHNGDVHTVSLSVRPLPDTDPDVKQGLLLVSFQDVGRTAELKPARGRRAAGTVEAQRIKELERDLTYTRENLQATIEEQQASNEELKSTNEELQSTNEELQSTNEELETSKEELQSVNEELVTVNAELQAKIEQLAGMQNDMKNLLDNVHVGTVFLDQNLVIRRFTREATRVFRLVSTDVGRPLKDIKSDLENDDLISAAQAVLDSLVPYECETRITGGACYLARIQPYRTLDNVIDGVVLTLTDISMRAEAEASVQAARQLAENIIDTVREPLILLDEGMTVVSASRSFYQRFQVRPENTIGRGLFELGDKQWNIPDLRELLETILPRDSSFEGFVVEHEFPGMGHCKLLLNARRVVSKDGKPPLILLAMEEMKAE
jgi:two-component system CheB/CheR fusion protein